HAAEPDVARLVEGEAVRPARRGILLDRARLRLQARDLVAALHGEPDRALIIRDDQCVRSAATGGCLELGHPAARRVEPADRAVAVTGGPHHALPVHEQAVRMVAGW